MRTDVYIHYGQDMDPPGVKHDPGTGRFSATPGGKTEYSHTTASQGMTPAEKAKRKEALAHAEHLKLLGHEGVKVTKKWTSHTIPGKGLGGTATYTTHHGHPKQ